jgi:peptidoglycan/LPS O-acetylase OafA/YrhL
MMQRQSRENNFGSLRLLFATLVILSHSPQIIDGNRSRELLTRVFGTISFGDLAVDGFFIISGYLITKSLISSSSSSAYLRKRILRIYPGFLASFWFCVFIVAPFAGVHKSFFSMAMLTKQLLLSFLLQWPMSRGAFPGMAIPNLNRSMWTISFEFTCYIGALCAGRLGFYSAQRRIWLIPIVLTCLAWNALSAPSYFMSYVRFEALFGIGTLFYVFGERIRFSSLGAAFSALMLFILLFDKRLAEASVAIFGGYLIFWAAFELPVLRLSKFANKTDLSYGIYLYAWPIASLICWRLRTTNPWQLAAITLPCAVIMAYLSWIFIESPALRQTHKGSIMFDSTNISLKPFKRMRGFIE